jgi:hypothetical protein
MDVLDAQITHRPLQQREPKRVADQVQPFIFFKRYYGLNLLL